MNNLSLSKKKLFIILFQGSFTFLILNTAIKYKLNLYVKFKNPFVLSPCYVKMNELSSIGQGG